MNKNFSTLLIIAAFLTLQIYSAFHAAEHNHMPHEHEGQICQLCFNNDNNELSNTEFSQLSTPKINIKKSVKIIDYFNSQNSIFFLSRAPPLYFPIS